MPVPASAAAVSAASPTPLKFFGLVEQDQRVSAVVRRLNNFLESVNVFNNCQSTPSEKAELLRRNAEKLEETNGEIWSILDQTTPENVALYRKCTEIMHECLILNENNPSLERLQKFLADSAPAPATASAAAASTSDVAVVVSAVAQESAQPQDPRKALGTFKRYFQEELTNTIKESGITKMNLPRFQKASVVVLTDQERTKIEAFNKELNDFEEEYTESVQKFKAEYGELSNGSFKYVIDHELQAVKDKVFALQCLCDKLLNWKPGTNFHLLLWEPGKGW